MYANVIECSRWLFPAIIMSGLLSPFVLVANVLLEVFKWLFR